MSDQSTSGYSNSRSRKSVNLARLVITLILLVAIATAVYFSVVREKGPRHLKLALVTWTEDPFWQPLIRGARDSADKTQVDLEVIQSKPNVEAQTQHIKDLLNSGVDGIAISPNNAIAQKAILDEATGKVPVVTFDTDAPDTSRKRFVSIDNYAAGRLCGDEMKLALPDGGPILISVGSVQMQHAHDRRQGAIDVLLDRGFDRNRTIDAVDAALKGSKYSVVATVTDGGDPAKAVEVIAAALKAHPEVKGVIGLFSYSAPAALEAAKQAGMGGKLQFVGFDDSLETQAGIIAGTIHSSILQDSYRAGFESIEVLANEARGTARGPAESTPILNVGINVLTDKNIEDLRKDHSIRQTGVEPATKPTTD